MTGRPLLLAGAGVVLLCLSAPPHAAARPLPEPSRAPSPAVVAELEALALLRAAVTAGRARTYSGTQHLASHRQGRASSTTVRLRHVPGLGTDVQVSGGASVDGDQDVARSVGADLLDERGVALLAEHYALAVVGEDGCAGRRAAVVESRVDGSDPRATPAGRFWVDRDSGLVLRREVYDAEGRTVRSSAYVDLRVTGGPVAVRAADAMTGDPVEPGSLEPGWPRELPGPFALVDVRARDVREAGRDAEVLQLVYSDGLSTTSVFAQRGSLSGPPAEGFREERVGGSTVWVRGSSPERVVWSAEGRTFTVLSDAPAEAVREAVLALPHERPGRDGLLRRAVRGAARVGGWVNPFA